MGISTHTVGRMKDHEAPEPSPKLHLLDEAGQPVSAQIQSVFLPLERRFRQNFHLIQDDAVIRNLFDRAGQQFAEIVNCGKPIEKPEALAWTILYRLAVSELRRSEHLVANGSVPSALADKVLENLVSNIGTAGQTFARIYARELAESLSEPERICATLKVLGWSSAEIGKHLKMKASAVDKLMQRLRDRCQGNLTNGRKPPSGGESS